MTNKIAENIDVYVKMTSTGNVYFGFIEKNKPIFRGNKRYWTNLPIYNIKNSNKITYPTKEIRLPTKEHVDFVDDPLKSYIQTRYTLGKLSPDKIIKIDNPYLIMGCFESFHKDGHWNTKKEQQFLCTGTDFRDYTTKKDVITENEIDNIEENIKKIDSEIKQITANIEKRRKYILI